LDIRVDILCHLFIACGQKSINFCSLHIPCSNELDGQAVQKLLFAYEKTAFIPTLYTRPEPYRSFHNDC